MLGQREIEAHDRKVFHRALLELRHFDVPALEDQRTDRFGQIKRGKPQVFTRQGIGGIISRRCEQ